MSGASPASKSRPALESGRHLILAMPRGIVAATKIKAAPTTGRPIRGWSSGDALRNGVGPVTACGKAQVQFANRDGSVRLTIRGLDR